MFYLNDVLPNYIIIFTILNENMQVFLNHNVLNFIWCIDEEFSRYAYATFQNIIRKSNCISVKNEKDRGRFFNRMRTVIAGKLKKI
jgi:hypothetical protein